MDNESEYVFLLLIDLLCVMVQAGVNKYRRRTDLWRARSLRGTISHPFRRLEVHLFRLERDTFVKSYSGLWRVYLGICGVELFRAYLFIANYSLEFLFLFSQFWRVFPTLNRLNICD